MAITGGQDQERVVQNKESYLTAARGRLSQGKIDRFLQENPNDYHRLADVESDLQSQTASPTPTSAPAAGLAAAAPTPGGATLGAPQISGGPIAGLMAAGPTSDIVSEAPDASMMPSTATTLPLRDRLGNRTYPSNEYVFGGLRRAY